MPLLVAGTTAAGSAQPTMPSFWTNHTRLLTPSKSMPRVAFAQQDDDSFGVGKMATPFAVPGAACDGTKRPIEGSGEPSGFATNHTSPPGAVAMPVPALKPFGRLKNSGTASACAAGANASRRSASRGSRRRATDHLYHEARRRPSRPRPFFGPAYAVTA